MENEEFKKILSKALEQDDEKEMKKILAKVTQTKEEIESSSIKTIEHKGYKLYIRFINNECKPGRVEYMSSFPSGKASIYKYHLWLYFKT